MFDCLHCNTLQHTATHCNTLQHIVNRNVLLPVRALPDSTRTPMISIGDFYGNPLLPQRPLLAIQ